MAQMVFLVVAFAAVLVAGTMKFSPISRQKREDDPDPLEAVVEHLSQRVDSLNAQLTQQASTFNTRIDSLEDRAASLETSVAFYAWNSVHPISVGPERTVILDTAVTNIGNAYDAGTGVFTVPVSGLYDFQATILSLASKVHLGMYVDGQLMAMGVAYNDGNNGLEYRDQTTMRIVVHVTSGQKVTVKNVDNFAIQLHSSHYTTFSGFLLKAD